MVCTADEFICPAGEHPNIWVQSCPKWIMKSHSISQLVEMRFFAQEGNLSAILNPENLTVEMKNYYRSFEAGVISGKEDRRKQEERERKSKM